MRSLFAALFAILVIAMPAMAANQDAISNSPAPTYDQPVPGPRFNWNRAALFDNGPVFNSAGTGPGGSNESVLQDASLGMSTYGHGQQISVNNTMSDDFSVPAGETWNVQDFVFFGYQTGSTTGLSTFTDVRFEILDGPPGSPTSAVVYGDLTTNALSTSAWSNCYRTLESTPGATNRPIMANTCNAVFSLPAGHYWVVTQAGGSLSSGPWYPPTAIWNVCATGDALQGLAGVYTQTADGSTGCPLGIPFLIHGDIAATPTQTSTWGRIKGMFR